MPVTRSENARRWFGVRNIVTIVRRLATDQGGVAAPLTAISMVLLLGVAGLGTEAGSWYVTKRSMQGAADAAAFSAAVAGSAGASYSADGNAVAANFGYVNGANHVTLQVNNPPSMGAYAGAASAYEVIISQPQPQLFSKLFMASAMTITARAVANTTGGIESCITTLGTQNGAGVTINGTDTITLGNCNLVDNATGSRSLTMNGNASLSANQVSLGGNDSLTGRATITASHGVLTNQTPAVNPFVALDRRLNSEVPASCGSHPTTTVLSGTATISPGKYCGGIVVTSATVTLNPGVYYINDGSFTINGNSTVTGNGVTIMFTSDNGTYGSLTVNGNNTITLSAPTTGDTAGFVFFESADAPENTVSINGGNNLNLTGMLYFPSQDLKYNGVGTSACSLIYANTITFNGNASLGGDCSGVAGVPDAHPTVTLVE